MDFAPLGFVNSGRMVGVSERSSEGLAEITSAEKIFHCLFGYGTNTSFAATPAS